MGEKFVETGRLTSCLLPMEGEEIMEKMAGYSITEVPANKKGTVSKRNENRRMISLLKEFYHFHVCVYVRRDNSTNRMTFTISR